MKQLIRRWLLNKLGGVPREDYRELLDSYLCLVARIDDILKEMEKVV